MTKGQIRHFFAGGNTGEGFYSLYDQVIGADANHLFILKGGPGTGKSTFMRKIGEELVTKGFNLEYIHCSADHNSLDGLVIPALKVAFIDGTAPHTTDPINPGVVDEIINLGAFWDLKGLQSKQTRIIEAGKKKKACYERAYVYLNAALGVYRNWRKTNFACLDVTAWLKMLGEIRAEIFADTTSTGKLGTTRHLFASAITADGPVHFLESVFSTATKLYILDGPPGSGRAGILQRLVTEAIELGLDAEVFHCALDPDKYEHLWIPALKAGVITSTWPHKFQPDERCRYLDTSALLNRQQYLFNDTLKESRLVFLDLWGRSTSWLGMAKKLHEELESYYIGSMNFEKSSQLRRAILNKLLS